MQYGINFDRANAEDDSGLIRGKRKAGSCKGRFAGKNLPSAEANQRKGAITSKEQALWPGVGDSRKNVASKCWVACA